MFTKKRMIKIPKADKSEPIHVEIDENGSMYWFRYGQLHRKDGPAAILSDGSRHWFKNGRWHREDGPAIVCPDGVKFFFLEDVQLKEQEFLNMG